MLSRTVWLAVPLLALAPLCLAGDEPSKPACTAQTRGKLWPEKNPVELCAPKRFHYEWQQLTIDVAQLKADAKAKEESAILPADPPPHD